MYFKHNHSIVLPFIFAEGTEGDPAPETAADKAAKVAFDDAQRARVNEIIAERVGETQRKNRAEFDKLLADQKAEFEAKLAALAAPKSGDGKGDDDKAAEFQRVLKDHKDTISTLKSQLEQEKAEIAKRDRTLSEVRKDNALRAAASKHNFTNVGQVLKLTSDSIEFDADSNSYIVRNEQGSIIQGDDMRNITLDAYFQKFAEENPYFVRSEARGGAGSQASAGAPGTFAAVRTKADLAKDLKLRIAYIQKNGLSAYEALPNN